MRSVRSSIPSMTDVNRVDEVMHSNTGRISRVAVGGALLGLGLGRGGVLGGLVALIGLEPLVAGIFNFSLVSMIAGIFEPAGYSETSDYQHHVGSTLNDSTLSPY